MRRRVSVRPTKANAIMGMVVGGIFCFIGFFVVIPTFGMFGLLWSGIAVYITGSSAYNVFSEKGLALSHIDIEDMEVERKETNSIEDKLIKLNELYEKRLITQEEFDRKKADLLEKM